MVTVVMGHNIQSVMEHVDNSTVHLNRSFLLKIEYDIIALSVKNKKADSSWMCFIWNMGGNSVKERWLTSLKEIYTYMYIYVSVYMYIYTVHKNKCLDGINLVHIIFCCARHQLSESNLWVKLLLKALGIF